MRIGYARVSTTDQKLQAQTDALERADCEEIYTETASGARSDRPVLREMLEFAREGDVIVVWKLDRLARSLKHLIQTVNDLGAAGIDLWSITEKIETKTPAGRLMFHLCACVAEFERDLVRERTAAGLAAARARGRVGGRPESLTPDQKSYAVELYRTKNYTVKKLCKQFGISSPTLYKYVNEANAKEK